MPSTKKQAILLGFVIGLVNLTWLYVAYFLGLHTSGIAVFQVFMLFWLLINIAAYVFALRALKRQNPSLSYFGGLVAGTIASLASAVCAVIAQIGYYKVVNPTWPEFMAQSAREYFESQGLSASKVQAQVDQARASFTLTNYAIQSAVAAIVLGVVLSAIIMIFLRTKPSTTEA